MRPGARYDVVIAGGGLAGLCLANQLVAADSARRVLVIEKKTHPLPEAAHKVGESSVEVASHYFRNVLGMTELLSEELPKFGLRFFMTQGDNRDIASRVECGPSCFLTVPSYQIDRGRFETRLAERACAAGADFMDGSRVTAVDLGEGEADHRVEISRGDERFAVACRWLVDACGRAALLKQKLGLAQANRHNVNAAWFRLDAPIEPDDWSDDLRWKSRLKHERRLSTNHFVGEGYWVWLIPLVGGRTSVGIVTDDRLHAFSQFRNFETALAWLDAKEPQCAASVRALADKRMDYLALRNYSYDAKRVFGEQRWALTGDAGIFIDPFYSPGSDFIGIANGFIADLVERDSRGEAVSPFVEIYDQTFRSLARAYLIIYHRQYPVMGNARVMSTKVVWDFAMYWGGVALLFFHDKLCDPAFMDRVRPLLQGFAYTNLGVQFLFRNWAAEVHDPEPRPGAFVDYAEIPFLAEMNRRLTEEFDDNVLLAQLEANLAFARELKVEIRAEATRTCPQLGFDAAAPETAWLEGMFESLGRSR